MAQRDMGKHALLLKSFSLDVESLHYLPIHEKIGGKKSFLSDTVPLEKLKIWYENCLEAHDDLVKNVIELTEEVKFIKTGTINEENFGLEFDHQYLLKKIELIKDMQQNVQDKITTLTRDEQKVAGVGKSQEQDKITAVKYLYEIHVKQYVPELLEAYASIRNIYEEVGTQKVCKIFNFRLI
jgi:hypothetical protein